MELEKSSKSAGRKLDRKEKDFFGSHIVTFLEDAEQEWIACVCLAPQLQGPAMNPSAPLMVVLLPETARSDILVCQFSSQRALERALEVLHSADSSYSSGASPEVPSFPALTSHLPGASFRRAANITAGSSLYTFAPSLHKLRETTEGEKQSSADSWAWCELHYKTCSLGTDGSTES